MIISLFESQIKDYIQKIRPPKHIRDELDIGYCFENNQLDIFEIRPDWRDESKKVQSPVMKAKFIKSKSVWKIYWMESDMKWHAYPGRPEVTLLEDVFDELEKDELHCFWG